MSDYTYEINTLGVTGHRPKALGLGAFEPKHPLWQEAYRFVQLSIERHGATRLVSGGALGFDMIAGKAAIESDIALELALPFPGYDKTWSDGDKRRLRWLTDRASSWHFVCPPGYDPKKYQTRNEYIVDNSDYLLALFNGRPSGTKNCLEYAKRAGKGWQVMDPYAHMNWTRA
jgi:uncharacterized phage-like protein YoqJ